MVLLGRLAMRGGIQGSVIVALAGVLLVRERPVMVATTNSSWLRLIMRSGTTSLAAGSGKLRHGGGPWVNING